MKEWFEKWKKSWGPIYDGGCPCCSCTVDRMTFPSLFKKKD